MIVASLLMLATQQVQLPAMSPATCRLAGMQVEQIGLSVRLGVPRHATAAEANAAERRGAELDVLAAAVAARFGKAKFDPSTNLFLFSNFDNQVAIDFARACIALPQEKSHS